MKQYILTKEKVEQIVYKLSEAGYQSYELTQYVRYSIKHGNSVFIHHQLHIIRATKGTKGSNIMFELFGAPNGKSHEGEDHRLDSWFFNGYTGKGDTAYREIGKIEDHEFIAKEILFQYAEELTPDEQDIYSEGAKQSIVVSKYERDPKARAECIRIYGYICRVCGFDFEQTYGELGKNYIHIHHLTPLKDIGEKYNPDPENDLIPVCPNCHSMLHKLDDPSDILGLKRLLK